MFQKQTFFVTDLPISVPELKAMLLLSILIPANAFVFRATLQCNSLKKISLNMYKIRPSSSGDSLEVVWFSGVPVLKSERLAG